MSYRWFMNEPEFGKEIHPFLKEYHYTCSFREHLIRLCFLETVSEGFRPRFSAFRRFILKNMMVLVMYVYIDGCACF
jgi:hypothetical protein